MKIAVPKEIAAGEPRVAAVPDTVKKLKALGADVAIEPGAGVQSGVPDAEYEAAGAAISADAVKDADIVLKVRRPEAGELPKYKRGALAIAIMDPYGNDYVAHEETYLGFLALVKWGTISVVIIVALMGIFLT